MALTLKVVPPSQGARWVREGFVQFGRRPLAYTLLFVGFLMAAMLLAIVPYIGGVLQMMSLPLLSLGFMIATREAAHGRPFGPLAFIAPLRGPRERRQSLLVLCALYGAGAVLILLAVDAMSGQAMMRLQELIARSDSTPEEVDALLSEPGITTALFIGGLLAALMSLPFWHAPALVHWAGQKPGQALFSSTLAVWRNKGAFLVYGLTWTGVIFAFGTLTALVFGLFGARQLAAMAALPAGLMFSTAFYASLLATFDDSFGTTTGEPETRAAASGA